MNDLSIAMRISSSGMEAQSFRMRTVAENLANADSTARTADGDPYRRRVVSFRNVLDRTLGATVVRVDRVVPDQSEFRQRYDPQHPAANAEGYVNLPNVNPVIEMMDMRQAQRSYEANLSMIEVARGMVQRTIDILRG
jgi:flagellar basal-body rod protein FlgC